MSLDLTSIEALPVSVISLLTVTALAICSVVPAFNVTLPVVGRLFEELTLSEAVPANVVPPV